MSKFKVGDKVRFIGEGLHKNYPERYPECGTVGIVVMVNENGGWIQWPQVLPFRQARMTRAGCDTTSTWRVTWLLSAI